MTIAFVQSRATQGSALDVQVLAYTSPVTAGSLLLLALRDSGGSGGANDPAISDTLGTTYTRVGRSGSGSGTIFLFCGLAPSSGANTVTVNGDGTTFIRLVIYEYSGNWLTSPFGTIATNAGIGSPETTGDVSPSGAALLFAICGTVSDVSFTGVTNSFTLGLTSSSRCGTAYRVVTSGGTYNTEFSWTGVDSGVGTQIATFLENPGPAITVQPTSQISRLNGEVNGPRVEYSLTAAGTNISAVAWNVGGVVVSDGGIYDITTTIAPGNASVVSTLGITPTTKVGYPANVIGSVTDSSGTTDTSTVTLDVYTGPTLTPSSAITNGSGQVTPAVASDEPNTLVITQITGAGVTLNVTNSFTP